MEGEGGYGIGCGVGGSGVSVRGGSGLRGGFGPAFAGQFLFNAISGFGGEGKGRVGWLLFRAFGVEADQRSEEAELTLVASTEAAHEEVDADSDSLSSGKRAVHGLGEKFRDISAGEHGGRLYLSGSWLRPDTPPGPDRWDRGLRPNQLISRQRRSAARAR